MAERALDQRLSCKAPRLSGHHKGGIRVKLGSQGVRGQEPGYST
jgi:hypothetical protein